MYTREAAITTAFTIATMPSPRWSRQTATAAEPAMTAWLLGKE